MRWWQRRERAARRRCSSAAARALGVPRLVPDPGCTAVFPRVCGVFAAVGPGCLERAGARIRCGTRLSVVELWALLTSLLTGWSRREAPHARCWRPGYLRRPTPAESHCPWSNYAGLRCYLSPAAAERCHSAPTFPPARPQRQCKPTLCSAVSLPLCACRWLVGRSLHFRSCRQVRSRPQRSVVRAGVRSLRVGACAVVSNADLRTEAFAR